jgi:hypothetical protein
MARLGLVLQLGLVGYQMELGNLCKNAELWCKGYHSLSGEMLKLEDGSCKMDAA